MPIPRCFVDLPLQAGQTLRLPEGPAQHLVKVLRMRSGDKVVLFNGQDGRDYESRLAKATKREVLAQILTATDRLDQPTLAIHLALGISKGDRMDFAIQKAVELGISSITPLFTERSVVRLSGERLEKRDVHWRRVIISACEQSGRRLLATLNPAIHLADWLQQCSQPVLLLDHRADTSLPDLPEPDDLVTLLTGPEGGLSEAERNAVLAAGCSGIRLGPRIMRTETAPLAAIAAIQTLWGDFR